MTKTTSTIANNHTTSPDGFEFIKAHESLVLNAYQCPAGVWTIGWGHTRTAKPGMVVTRVQAERLLVQDLRTAEEAVNEVKVPLTRKQFDALVSFVFNVGVGAFKKSTLLRLLNQGKYEAVPAQLARWNKANGKVLNGLVRRRKEEAAMWLEGSDDDLGAALMPQAIQSPDKPLTKSRTMIGSVTSVAGTGVVLAAEPLAQASAFISDNQDHLTVLGAPLDIILTVAAVLAIAGSMLAIYARWDDKRQGRL
jgi:lysozyme